MTSQRDKVAYNLGSTQITKYMKMNMTLQHCLIKLGRWRDRAMRSKDKPCEMVTRARTSMVTP